MCKVFSFSTKEEINELTQEEMVKEVQHGRYKITAEEEAWANQLMSREEFERRCKEPRKETKEEAEMLEEFYTNIGKLAKIIQDKDNQDTLVEIGMVQKRTLELLKEIVTAVQVGY